MRAIFIDFDGVLHPAGGPEGACLPFEWLCDLKALLSAHPPVRIVVHSSWRLTYPHEEIREFLSGLNALEIDIVGPGEKRQAITALGASQLGDGREPCGTAGRAKRKGSRDRGALGT